MSSLKTFVTRSGEEVNLRFVKKGDADLLVDMFHRLSSESKRLRFHLYTAKLPPEQIWQEAERLSNLDPRTQVGILATTIEPEGREHAVGVARFARATAKDEEAEVAIVVRDDFQRKGLGRHLLIVLADIAREMGIVYFTGWVVADNLRLMKLIKNLELKIIESDMRYGERKIRIMI